MEYVLVLVATFTTFTLLVLLVLLVARGDNLAALGLPPAPPACRNANTAMPSTTTNAAARPATFLMRYLGDILRLGDIASSTLADRRGCDAPLPERGRPV